MGKLARVNNVIMGLVMIVIAILLIVYDTSSYEVIATILSISMLLAGARQVIYYIRMARHMVGGKSILYRGIILLDLGLFTSALDHIPQFYVLIYLMAIHLLTGMIIVGRAFDYKKLQIGTWKRKLLEGIVVILFSLSCLTDINNSSGIVDLYALGLLISAMIRISTAFKKTAIVYVP